MYTPKSITNGCAASTGCLMIFLFIGMLIAEVICFLLQQGPVGEIFIGWLVTEVVLGWWLGRLYKIYHAKDVG